MAFELKEDIEKLGYHTFVKTTGGKGVHIVAPIEPRWEFRVAREATLELIAKAFVEKNSKTALPWHIKKDIRKNRVLIDIYRNSTYQTIVSPYSVRGRAEGASFDAACDGTNLAAVTDPSVFNIHTAAERLLTAEGDAVGGDEVLMRPLCIRISESKAKIEQEGRLEGSACAGCRSRCTQASVGLAGPLSLLRKYRSVRETAFQCFTVTTHRGFTTTCVSSATAH